jgi:hypothetical protein
VLLWVLSALMPAPSIGITLGAEGSINRYGEGEHLYNFLGWGSPEMYGERSARRAGPDASFVIPHAFRLGAPLELAITACGCGITAPLHLTINDTTFTIPTGDEWRSYRFLVRQRPSIHGHDLYLKWESAAPLGPLVHRVGVHAQQPAGSRSAPLLLGGGVALLLLLEQRRAPCAKRLLHPALLLWVAVLVASALAGRLRYEPHLLPWGVLVALGGVAALAVSLLTPLLLHRLLLWALVGWLLAAPQVLGTWVLDDAYISFRYARNLVAGAGLTFNPGGEVVEGYTNFLWTLMIAAGMAAGFEPLLTAQVLCTALALATVLLLYRVADAWWHGRIWSLIPPLVLALQPAFVLYTARGSGMETALVTFLALLALWRTWQAQHWRGAVLAGMLCALMMMARPDGALVFLAGWVVLGAAAVWGVRGAGARWHLLAGLSVGMVLLYAPYFIWRYSYYGYLLPNTFYAKTGATVAQVVRGLEYTAAFWSVQGVVIAALLLFSLVWLRRGGGQQPGERRAVVLLWLFFLLTLLYVTAVGGDHFPLGRFFVPVLPPYALLIAHTIATMEHHAPAPRRPLAVGASVLLLLVAICAELPHFPASDSRAADTPVWRENKVALKNAEYGYWLQRNTPPDTVIATGIAGALPYYAERHVIDALGLNDLHIAHTHVETMGQGVAGAEKTDVPYILNQHPDYIPMSSAGIFWEHPRFQTAYTVVEVEGPRGGTLEFFRIKAPTSP